MKVRMRIVMPALLSLAGCASTPYPMAGGAPPVGQTSAAAPQQVDAVSDALGRRLDTMIATRRSVPATTTRW